MIFRERKDENMDSIDLRPIGFVETEASGYEVRHKDSISHVVLDSDLEQALDGVEDFSHIYVLFWMHEVSEEARKSLKVHPRGRRDIPLLGIFATRTPHRPNPIGLTLVEILSIQGSVITVRGLDAFDGTPVLDIKPFDSWDAAENPKVPEWWIRLQGERKEHHPNGC
jgi:tRNA-Thr(GGU) m(6)t(6)A37 methyltransferase TsaA